jgi:hypothetical protein
MSRRRAATGFVLLGMLAAVAAGLFGVMLRHRPDDPTESPR